jgi:hypothetical protein
MTSPSLQKFKRWAALLRAERNSLGPSLESFAMDWEADLSASREDRRHEPAAGEAQPLTEAQEREAFEEVISDSPYERELDRFPDDATKYAWPGSYRDSGVDLAWCAWQARAALATHPAPVAPAAPAQPVVPAGWRIARTLGKSIVVCAPDGSWCLVEKGEKEPRLLPTELLYALAEAMLAAAPSAALVDAKQPEQPLGDASGPGDPVASLPTPPIAAGGGRSDQSNAEN